MAEPRLSSLHRVVQKLGLDEVIPHLTHASDNDLHAPFAKFLFFGECHEDLDIPEKRFNPTALPEIAYSDVRNDNMDDRAEGRRRFPLMKPFFTTISEWEIYTLVSHNPRFDKFVTQFKWIGITYNYVGDVTSNFWLEHFLS